AVRLRARLLEDVRVRRRVRLARLRAVPAARRVAVVLLTIAAARDDVPAPVLLLEHGRANRIEVARASDRRASVRGYSHLQVVPIHEAHVVKRRPALHDRELRERRRRPPARAIALRLPAIACRAALPGRIALCASPHTPAP